MVVTDITGKFAVNKGKSVGGTVRRLPRYQSETTELISVSDISEYEIAQSLKFNGADQALERIPSVSSNQRTFTLSWWVKPSGDETNQRMIGLIGPQFSVMFGTGGILSFFANTDLDSQVGGGTAFDTIETYLDCSNWMHCVLALDTTQSIETERMKLYVNGVRVEDSEFNTRTYPAQNANFYWGQSGTNHAIGRYTSGFYLNGYMADVHIIDGVQLTPDSFGKYDPFGRWVAKDYTDPQVLDSVIAVNDITNITSTNTISAVANVLPSGTIENTSTQTNPLSSGVRSTAINGDTWVCVGEGAVSGSSTCFIETTVNGGATWSVDVGPNVGNSFYQDVAYANGMFVVVGSGEATVATSTDGLNWTERFRDTNGRQLRRVTYNQYNGKWAAVGRAETGYYYFLVSSDGITWTEQTGFLTDEGFYYVAGDSNGRWWAAAQNKTSMWYSDNDGASWVSVGAFPNNAFQGFQGLDISPTGEVYAVASAGLYKYSPVNNQMLQIGNGALGGNTGDVYAAGSFISINSSTQVFTTFDEGFTYYVWNTNTIGNQSFRGFTEDGICVRQIQSSAGGPTFGFMLSYEYFQKNRLTISGALSDGFRVDDPIFNGDGGARDQIVAIDDTKIDRVTTNVAFVVGDNVIHGDLNGSMVVASTNNFDLLKVGSLVTQGSAVAEVIDFEYETNTITYIPVRGAFAAGVQDKAYRVNPVGSPGTVGGILKFPPGNVGADTFGNNDWSANLGPFTATDSVLDTPTDYGTDTGAGGEMRSNYATFNAMGAAIQDGQVALTLSNGNLTVAGATPKEGTVCSTLGFSSGKWYAEFTMTNSGTSENQIGIAREDDRTGRNYIGWGENYGYGWEPYIDRFYHRGVQTLGKFGASFSGTRVYGVAVDMDNNTLSFYVDGSLVGTETGIDDGTYMFAWADQGSSGIGGATANFGQTPWTYSAPSGYKALNTANLP